MSKGEQTRTLILARAAGLFNRRGYFGSSLSALMGETGLGKGSIYHLFPGKDQLALEAFDYAFDLVQQRVCQELAGKAQATSQLHAMVAVFRGLVEDPPLVGGCPVLNTAIEADDAHEGLRDRARGAMDVWHNTIRDIVLAGQERHELRAEVDPEAVATVLITTLEGAVMMSKLYRDRVYMQRVIEHLTAYLETLLQV